MREQLTILMPLRDRGELTLRWMEYAERTRFPFRVVIANGGSDSGIERRLTTHGAYPHVSYEYRRFPYDARYADYYAKMVAALSGIETPFVALTDNDSFLMASGLEKSLEFLLKNPDYSACRGQHVDFKLGGTSDETAESVYGSHLEIHRLYFDKRHTIWRSLEAEQPLDRIEEWSRCININYYNVHRREHVLAAWRFIAGCNLMDLFLTDVAVTLFTLAAGKTKVFDYPYMMRQQNTHVAASKEARGKADILDRMFMDPWAGDVRRVVEAAARQIAGSDESKYASAVERIRGSIKNHYADRLFTYLKRRDAAEGPKAEVPDITVPDYMEISKPEEMQGDFADVAGFLMKGRAGQKKKEKRVSADFAD